MLRKQNDNFQENLSRPGIIDARARYRAEARRLRNTGIGGVEQGKKISSFYLESNLAKFVDQSL